MSSSLQQKLTTLKERSESSSSPRDHSSLRGEAITTLEVKHRSMPLLNQHTLPQSKLENFKQRMRTMSQSSMASIVSTSSLQDALSTANSARNSVFLIKTDFDFLTATKEQAHTPSPVASKKLNSLQKAVYDDDLYRVRRLISQKDRDVNKIDSVHKCTALHIAASFNRLEIAKQLLDPTQNLHGTWGNLEKKYADVSNTDAEGRTPYLIAAKLGFLEMAKLLLDNNANVNATDTFGCNGLHYAILSHDHEMFALLLKHHIRVSNVDKSGNTLLHHSIRLAREEMSVMLIEHNHPITIVNWEGKSCLHMAVVHDSPKVALALTNRGASKILQDIYDHKPSDYINPNKQSAAQFKLLLNSEFDAKIGLVKKLASQNFGLIPDVTDVSSLGENMEVCFGCSYHSQSVSAIPLSESETKGNRIINGADWKSETSELDISSDSDDVPEADVRRQKGQDEEFFTPRTSSSNVFTINNLHVKSGLMSIPVISEEPDYAKKYVIIEKVESTDSKSSSDPLGIEVIDSDEDDLSSVKQSIGVKKSAIHFTSNSPDISSDFSSDSDSGGILDLLDSDDDVSNPCESPQNNLAPQSLASEASAAIETVAQCSTGARNSETARIPVPLNQAPVLNLSTVAVDKPLMSTEKALLLIDGSPTAVVHHESVISSVEVHVVSVTANVGLPDNPYKAHSSDDQDDESLTDNADIDVFELADMIIQSLTTRDLKISMERIKIFLQGAHTQLDQYDKIEKKLINALNSAGLELNLQVPLTEVEIMRISTILEDVGTEVLNLERESAKFQSQYNNAQKRVDLLTTKMRSMQEEAEEIEKCKAQLLRLQEENGELAIKADGSLAVKDDDMAVGASVQLEEVKEERDCLRLELLEAAKRSDSLFAKIKLEIQSLRTNLHAKEIESLAKTEEADNLKTKNKELIVENSLVKKFSEETEKANLVLINERGIIEEELRIAIARADDPSGSNRGSKASKSSSSEAADQKLTALSFELAEAKESISLLNTKAEGFKIEMIEKGKLEIKLTAIESKNLSFRKMEGEYNEFKYQSELIMSNMKLELQNLQIKSDGNESTKISTAYQNVQSEFKSFKERAALEAKKMKSENQQLCGEIEQSTTIISSLRIVEDQFIQLKNQTTEVNNGEIKQLRIKLDHEEREHANSLESKEATINDLDKTQLLVSNLRQELADLRNKGKIIGLKNIERDEAMSILSKCLKDTQFNLTEANARVLELHATICQRDPQNEPALEFKELNVSEDKQVLELEHKKALESISGMKKGLSDLNRLYNEVTSDKQKELKKDHDSRMQKQSLEIESLQREVKQQNTNLLEINAKESNSNMKRHNLEKENSVLRSTLDDMRKESCANGKDEESTITIQSLRLEIQNLRSESKSKYRSSATMNIESNSHQEFERQFLDHKHQIKSQKDEIISHQKRLSILKGQIDSSVHESSRLKSDLSESVYLLDQQSEQLKAGKSELLKLKSSTPNLLDFNSENYKIAESHLQLLAELVIDTIKDTKMPDKISSDPQERVSELLGILQESIAFLNHKTKQLDSAVLNLEKIIATKVLQAENLELKNTKLTCRLDALDTDANVGADVSIEIDRKISSLLRQVGGLKEEIKLNGDQRCSLETELIDRSNESRRKFQSMSEDYSRQLGEMRKRSFEVETKYNLFQLEHLEVTNSLKVENNSISSKLQMKVEELALLGQQAGATASRATLIQQKVFDQQSQLLECQFQSNEEKSEIIRLSSLVDTLEKVGSAQMAECNKAREEGHQKDADIVQLQRGCNVYECKLKDLERVLNNIMTSNQPVVGTENKNTPTTTTLQNDGILIRENEQLKIHLAKAKRRLDSMAGKSKAVIDKKLQKIVNDYEVYAKERKEVERQRDNNRAKLDEANDRRIRELYQEMEGLRKK